MKILIIAPQPFFTIRGTPLAVKELVAVLTKAGHRVDMITFHLGDDIQLPRFTIFRNRLLFGVIKSIPPGFSAKKFILDLILLPRALFMIIKNKYQVVHCVEEAAYFLAWFRWLGRFKMVYDMDSDIPRQLVESGKLKNRFLFRLAQMIERFAIKKSDAVVTICPVFTGKIRKLFPAKRVFQIEDVSVSDEITPAEGKAGTRKVILYTGNLQPYQGVEMLINGFIRIKDNHPNTELVLIGGEEDQIGCLQKKYNNRQIIFTGKRPQEEMPRLLGAADILVSPRLKGENTPYKIYSYLACGKPVLATDIISHSQILANGRDSLLVDPTAAGIARGLEKLLGDNDFCRIIGEGARELFEAKYSRECYQQKIYRYIKFLEGKDD